jgi:hypothetical protein
MRDHGYESGAAPDPRVMVSARLGARKTGGIGEQVRCERVRDPAAAGRRRPFEVRWQAAGRSRSKSFITRKLADSYRAELVRAARMGLDFDPLTGEPAAWNLPEPATVTWYQEATEYAAMKWPSLAAHSRASLAEALATVTPVLVRPDTRQRPDPRELRMVLYQHALTPPAQPSRTARPRRSWTGRGRRHCPSAGLSEPTVLRTALEG